MTTSNRRKNKNNKKFLAFAPPPPLMRPTSSTRRNYSRHISASFLPELSPFPDNTFLLSNDGEAATTATTPSGVYEATLPPTETLVGMGIVIVLVVVLCWVWANQVVPVSRTNLAISKKSGAVKEYLDELKQTEVMEEEQADHMSTMLNATMMAEVSEVEQLDQVVVSKKPDNDRAFERWLFTDWLQDNKSARKPGRQKEPALPILKDAKWNSGDNPVLVASALIGLGVLLSAITERVFSS